MIFVVMPELVLLVCLGVEIVRTEQVCYDHASWRQDELLSCVERSLVDEGSVYLSLPWMLCCRRVCAAD